MLLVGSGAGYIANGSSYFAAEPHIWHLDNAHAGTKIRTETQTLLREGTKMHLRYQRYVDDRE